MSDVGLAMGKSIQICQNWPILAVSFRDLTLVEKDRLAERSEMEPDGSPNIEGDEFLNDKVRSLLFPSDGAAS
jgi:hypothetical protein